MYCEDIKDAHITQGALVLILNNHKPEKDGWYRKTREFQNIKNSQKSEVVYILEKSLNNNFKELDFKNTRHYYNIPLMSAKLNLNNFDKNHLAVLEVVGVDSIILVKNDYKIETLNLESKNVRYNDIGNKIYDELSSKENNDIINNFINSYKRRI